MRLSRFLLPISILLVPAVVAAPATASTEVGQLLTPSTGSCAGNSEIEPQVETGTNPYTVPNDGVITAWKTQTAAYAGTMKLKVFRPASTPGEYLVVGEEGPHSVAANTAPTFSSGVRIPVQAGDLVGMRGIGLNCVSYQPGKPGYKLKIFESTPDPAQGTTATPNLNGSEAAIEMLAFVEPDADRDGYGDETQDQCPGDAGAQVAPCPILPLQPPPPPAPDTKAPQISLSSKARQDALRTRAVIVLATADEDATLTGSGSVNVPGSGAFSLAPRTVAAAGGVKTGIRLALSKSVRRKIARALKEGRRVRASVHVVARDAAGNSANATQAVNIRRSVRRKHK